MSEILRQSQESVFTLKSELDPKYIEFLQNLEPNFDPRVITDAGYELPPLFVYGTFLPGQTAGNHMEENTAALENATLSGYDLFFHKRFTRYNTHEPEAFPYTSPSGNPEAVVKGALVQLQDSENRTVLECLEKEDSYEELESGMYQRQIITALNEHGEEVLAMCYIGQEALKNRDYLVAVNGDGQYWPDNTNPDKPTEKAVGLFYNKEDPHIEDGDFVRWKQENDKTA